MTTDETAKAILAEDRQFVTTHPIQTGHTFPIADLQAMAKLWLLRDEIIAAMQKAQPNCERLGLVDSNKKLSEALAKLEQLGEQNDGR